MLIGSYSDDYSLIMQALPSREEGHQVSVSKSPENMARNRFRNTTACKQVVFSFTELMLLWLYEAVHSQNILRWKSNATTDSIQFPPFSLLTL